MSKLKPISLSLMVGGAALLGGCDMMNDSYENNPATHPTSYSSQSVTYSPSSAPAANTGNTARTSQATPTSVDPKPAAPTEAQSAVPLTAPAVGQ